MRIAFHFVDGELGSDIITLDVNPDMTFADVKALIEGDTNIPPSSQYLFFKNRLIEDSNLTLENLQIKDGDMLGLTKREPRVLTQRGAGDQTAGRNPRRARRGPDPEAARLQILSDGGLQKRMRDTAPHLLEAAENRDLFHERFAAHQRELAQAEAEKEARLAILNSDPFNVEAQKEIEEMIRLQRVDDNLQEAIENNPESFGNVTMLYINVMVNDVPIKAFVDSGAQTTIMSPSTAERTNVMRLIDHRYSGVAVGVGTAKILGRVHSAELQIGDFSLPSSFTVMEGKDVDLLLGLDMLKRHQMEISLKDNCLKIRDKKFPFLPDHEVPKSDRAARANEPKIEGPDGTKIGAQSGTVQPSSSTASPASASLPHRSVAEDDPSGPSAEAINKITELGFSREEAVQALSQTGGNVELAIGLLL